MRRRLPWLALGLVAFLVAAVVVAVVSVRPGISDARDRVDQAWTPLRAPLVARYQALAGVELALAASGGQSRSVTRDLSTALSRWQRTARVDDPGPQAPLANTLEGLARRVKANYVASAKLRAAPSLGTALSAFDAAVVSPPAVAAYNRAVTSYQHERSGTVHGLVAGVFGFESRPLLELGG